MTGRQRSLLIEAPPLQVIPQLAKEIGLNEAIVLQQIHYWLLRSDNDRDGRKWVYKTTQEWAEEFPFWSEPTIKRTIATLKKRGLILITKRAANSWDRTSWYSVDYEALSRIGSICADASDQSDPMHGIKTTESKGSRRSGRSDQPDLITNTTETTSETTAKRPARRPGEDYTPAPEIVEWVKGLGYAPYLDLHVQKFRNACATQRRKAYQNLDAAFKNCVMDDWGKVRQQAQIAARHGQPGAISAGITDWWKTSDGIASMAKRLGVERQDKEHLQPWENAMWFKARVCVAAGEGPWSDEKDGTFQHYLKRAREAVAHA